MVIIYGDIGLHYRQTGKQQNPVEMSKLVFPLRKWSAPNSLSAILPEGSKAKVHSL
jgi:hypothetical protein